MKKPLASNNKYFTSFRVQNSKKLQYIAKAFDTVHNVQEGAVRSAKTVDNIMAFAMQLDTTPDELHLAIAATDSSAQAVLFDSNGFGLKYFPDWQERYEIVNGRKVKRPQRIFEAKYKNRDALILLPPSNSDMPVKYIVSFGGNKNNSHEPYRGWSVGMVLATEYDLLHPNTWQEIENRVIESKHRRIFIDLNPNDIHHAVYKKFEQWERSQSLNYLHATLRDNPALTQERIDEIVKEYDPESEDYKRYILGQRISPHGLIYRVRDYNIIDNYNLDDYAYFVAVADPGEQGSATVFLLIGITRDRKHLDVIKEYYHKNEDLKGLAVKMPQDYAEDYIEFCKASQELIGYELYERLTDNDITFRRELDRLKWKKNYGHNFNVPKKDEIDDRIKTGVNMLYKGRLRFYRECEKTIQAFKTAIYCPKKEKLGKYERLDDPKAGTMIDPIDCVEYVTTYLKDELKKYGE